ncbi:hypothetical protein BDC45DRAFT_533793 [Circinella umbellata]|nr:hypothetical protein BDC45DRAFT_533793 [Circinella umbellata]
MTRYVTDIHPGHGCIEMTSCSTSLSALSLLFGNLVFDKSCTVVKESKDSDKKSKASVGWQGRAWRAKTAIKKIKSFGWVAGPGMGEQFCCSRFVAWQMTRYVIDIHPEHHAEKTREYQFIVDKKENVVSPLVSSIFCKLVEVK